ncbi:DUF58 domain-containing protein [Paramicrobacterium fandaimingii]|uniref:DUF58 domain-containing protein n=1 Tax=Paramicrobacterium fandaimingii TaxID=2708079 RepID=UPI0014206D8A|nr:DUF58 domain-containing protein [Microbacterium fandaimingii]
MTSARHTITWHPSGSFAGAVIAGVVVLGVGFVSSRPDIACCALPLLSWAAWMWRRRPADETEIGSEIDTQLVRDGASRLTATLQLRASADVEISHARMIVGGSRTVSAVLDCRETAQLVASSPVLHSGPCDVLAARFTVASADGSFVSQPTAVHEVSHTVRPEIVPLPRLLLPHRLHGLTGSHESTRPGDGGGFRDIHPFAPGDRLRRIDWKATARLSRRAGDLYVRRTFAASDATTVIVMDTGDELGESVAEWARGRPHKSGITSMDAAREAAVAIAVAYTEAGDQVALQNLALGTRQVRRGSGDRHRERLIATIAETRPNGVGVTRRRAPLVAAGAIIYVLSTFVDAEAASLAAMWRAVGHRVIAIDTLPAGTRHGLTPEQTTAHTILMMERDDRLVDMESTGVSVVRWADAPGVPRRDAQFSVLARERGRAR